MTAQRAMKAMACRRRDRRTTLCAGRIALMSRRPKARRVRRSPSNSACLRRRSWRHTHGGVDTDAAKELSTHRTCCGHSISSSTQRSTARPSRSHSMRDKYTRRSPPLVDRRGCCGSATGSEMISQALQRFVTVRLASAVSNRADEQDTNRRIDRLGGVLGRKPLSPITTIEVARGLLPTDGRIVIQLITTARWLITTARWPARKPLSCRLPPRRGSRARRH